MAELSNRKVQCHDGGSRLTTKSLSVCGWFHGEAVLFLPTSVGRTALLSILQFHRSALNEGIDTSLVFCDATKQAYSFCSERQNDLPCGPK